MQTSPRPGARVPSRAPPSSLQGSQGGDYSPPPGKWAVDTHHLGKPPLDTTRPRGDLDLSGRPGPSASPQRPTPRLGLRSGWDAPPPHDGPPPFPPRAPGSAPTAPFPRRGAGRDSACFRKFRFGVLHPGDPVRWPDFRARTRPGLTPPTRIRRDGRGSDHAPVPAYHGDPLACLIISGCLMLTVRVTRSWEPLSP